MTSAHLDAQRFRTPAPEEQAAIPDLYRKDKQASVTGNWEALATLWTPDGVALPPGEQPVVGIDAIRSWLKRDRMDPSKVEISEYSMTCTKSGSVATQRSSGVQAASQ